MRIERIIVEWMTKVPPPDESGCRYDHATWAAKGFKSIEKARAFAQIEAKRNAWGQVWIKTEFADRPDAPNWQWDTDHDATEIVEATS